MAVNAEVDIANDTWFGETRDISVSGASIILDRELKEGEKFGLTLILTQDGIEDAREEPFQTQAEVVWSAPTDAGPWIVGLRFSKMNDRQIPQLERFLKAAATPK